VRTCRRKSRFCCSSSIRRWRKPFEPAAEVFQVRGPHDLDGALELARAQASYRLIELSIGLAMNIVTRSRAARPGNGRRELQPQDALRALAGPAHGFHLAVDQGIAGVETLRAESVSIM